MLTLDQLIEALYAHPVLTAVAAAVLGFVYLFLPGRHSNSSSAREVKLAEGDDNEQLCPKIRTLRQLPCPPSTLPILGNTLDMAVRQRERLYDWFLEQCELHKGPWRLQVLDRPPVIVIASPELFEDVMKTQFELFPRGENECEILRDYFGDGVFTVNGDAWHRHRSTTAQLFALPAMKSAMHSALREKIRVLCHVVGVYASRDEEFSLKAVLGHFTADVFTKMALGVERNNLVSGLKGYSDDFIESSRTISYAMQLRFHQPMWLWKLQRKHDWGIEKKFKECIKFTNFLIYNLINESIAKKNLAPKQSQHTNKRRTTSEASSTSSTMSSVGSSTQSSSCSLASTASTEEVNAPIPAPRDLISIFLEHNSLTDSLEVDTQVIRDTIINFISPGTDTTSHCMSFFIVMMNRYPKVLRKIQDELQTKLPQLFRSGNGASAEPNLSVEDLSKLVYLDAAIHESLRLNPQYAVTAREASADTVLSDGTFVPKGTRVVMAFYAAMRQRSVWGKDAMRFKPERWIDPTTGGLISMSPFKFSAFFAGPRKCLGMKFALLEVKMTMAVLLSKFQIKTTENPWFLTYQVGLAVSVKGPVTVRVTPFKKTPVVAVSNA